MKLHGILLRPSPQHPCRCLATNITLQKRPGRVPALLNVSGAGIPASPAPGPRSGRRSLASPDRQGSPANLRIAHLRFSSVLRVSGETLPRRAGQRSRDRASRLRIRAPRSVLAAPEQRVVRALAPASPRIPSARQAQRIIHPVQQRAGIDPRFGFVGVAGRRLALVKRLANARRSTARVGKGISTSAPTARAAEATTSNGVLIFAR